jgi:hypothetical protein
MQYARQARNIQNKPVKNMDKVQLELRRLKYALKVWTLKAICNKFSGDQMPETADAAATPRKQHSFDAEEETLLKRTDVQQYVELINSLISTKLDVSGPSPRKVRLSVASPLLRKAPMTGTRNFIKLNGLQPQHIAPVRKIGNVGDDDDGEDANDDYDFDCKQMLFAEGKLNYRTRDSVLNCDFIRDRALDNQDPEESEKMVVRMMEILNEEKKLVTGDGCDGEREVEMNKVDKAIEEKEEILVKLMESVKGYAAMKSEFEKLLEAIGALENERTDLENELDKAKRLAAHTSSSTNDAAVERIRERFFKVKEELKQMKEERSNKENAYRVMQRESKRVGEMQRELTKLKEARVTLMKQQKQQSLQMLKMKKEQSIKLSNLKKSDIKKQRLMNNLKSELVKKERVLGHKDKEISRINSKLKACEDHISQLLKIQHKNRTKSSNNLLGFNELKVSLIAADYEHLVSSKSMLDNLVVDRLERRRVRSQYEKKSASLLELNKELVQEVNELDVLTARKAALRTTMKQFFHSNFTAETVSGQKSKTVQFPQVETADDDDNWFLDSEESPRDLSTEELEVRAEYHDTSDLIAQTEVNIDRISRELDLFNADLDTLSQRIDKDTKDTKDNIDTWEMLGKEIVGGLSLPQAQSVIWDILNEKSDALIKLAAAEEVIIDLQESLGDLNESYANIEKQISNTENLMQERLLLAEKQRSQDVWALIRANASGAVPSDVETGALRVAVARAQELETELEGLVATEQNKNSQIQELCSKLAAANEIIATQNAVLRTTNREDDFQARSVSTLTDTWNRIGIRGQEMENLLSDLQSSSRNIYLSSIEQHTATVHELLASITEREMDYSVLCRVMDASPVNCNDTSEAGVSLTSKLESYSNMCEEVALGAANRLHSVAELKDQLLDLMSEMWLGINDLPEELQVLMKLSVSRSWPKLVLDISNTELAEITDLAHRLDAFGYQLTNKSLAVWTESIKKLNIKRGTTTMKLLRLRESAASLCSDLGLTEKEALQALFNSHLQTFAPSEGSCENDIETMCVSPKAASIIVTATLSHCPSSSLYSSSPSNPPGSAQLLTAAEQLNFLLTSVHTNRKIVQSHLVDLSRAFNGLFDGTIGTALFPSLSAEPSQESINDAMGRLNDLKSHIVGAIAVQCVLLSKLVEDGKNIKNSLDRDSMISSTLWNCFTAPLDKGSSHTDMRSVQESFDSIQEMATFLEEEWLTQCIRSIGAEWNCPSTVNVTNSIPSQATQRYTSMIVETVGKVSGMELVKFALYFMREITSLQCVVDGIKELQRLDGSLTKHIADMEEFETQSKLNRSKLLSGMAAALVS